MPLRLGVAAVLKRLDCKTTWPEGYRESIQVNIYQDAKLGMRHGMETRRGRYAFSPNEQSRVFLTLDILDFRSGSILFRYHNLPFVLHSRLSSNERDCFLRLNLLVVVG